MKFYGNADLQNNFAQQLRFDVEASFPTDTSRMLGRVIFKDKRLYICIDIGNDLPVWVPLTNELNTYVHEQTTPSATWTITHNLDTTAPLVQIYYNGSLIIPDEVTSISNNACTVTFGAAIAGRAVLMYGDIDGAPKSQYAFTFVQTTLSDTWTINHNLGYNPIVRVFIGQYEVQPATISFPTLNQTVITFNTPQTGTARLI